MGLVFFLGLAGTGARAQRPEKCRKLGEEAEPVVHFGKWTTSLGGKAVKGPETVVRGRASGPLWRVDH